MELDILPNDIKKIIKKYKEEIDIHYNHKKKFIKCIKQIDEIEYNIYNNKSVVKNGLKTTHYYYYGWFLDDSLYFGPECLLVKVSNSIIYCPSNIYNNILIYCIYHDNENNYYMEDLSNNVNYYHDMIPHYYPRSIPFLSSDFSIDNTIENWNEFQID